MEPPTVCTICKTEGVLLHCINRTNLHEFNKKEAYMQHSSKDTKPMLACAKCCDRFDNKQFKDSELRENASTMMPSGEEKQELEPTQFVEIQIKQEPQEIIVPPEQQTPAPPQLVQIEIKVEPQFVQVKQESVHVEIKEEFPAGEQKKAGLVPKNKEDLISSKKQIGVKTEENTREKVDKSSELERILKALHDPATRKISSGRNQYTQDNRSDQSKQVGYNPDGQNAYYLYTRANPSVRQRLSKDSNVAATNFNAKKRTKVIIHGWQGSAADGASTVLAQAFLKAQDVNVIVVDWSAGAAGDYIVAVRNTGPSGAAVARFISWLNKKTGSSIKKYHIVGFSLGGQQAGIIGRNLGGQVPYITALDPAGPVWTNHPDKFRQNDGLYTEVIHTNAGGAGYPTPIGHVDFYPNGGTEMPGCAGDTTHTCNHFRSFYYFAESITSGGFTGTQCDSLEKAQKGNCRSAKTLKLGGTRPKTGSRGIFYLATNPAAPFSRR